MIKRNVRFLEFAILKQNGRETRMCQGRFTEPVEAETETLFTKAAYKRAQQLSSERGVEVEVDEKSY